MKLIPRTVARLYMVNRVMAVIATIALTAMMLFSVTDIIGRYFFNSPIKGILELVAAFLVCGGTWGWGYCQMQKGHINVTIILERFSRRVQAILRSIAYLMGAGMFSLLCWQMFLLAKRYISLTRGNVTETLHIPYYPFMFLLVISSGMLVLILLVDLWHSLAEVVRK